MLRSNGYPYIHFSWPKGKNFGWVDLYVLSRRPYHVHVGLDLDLHVDLHVPVDLGLVDLM